MIEKTHPLEKKIDGSPSSSFNLVSIADAETLRISYVISPSPSLAAVFPRPLSPLFCSPPSFTAVFPRLLSPPFSLALHRRHFQLQYIWKI
ncbi:hypothetical protein ACOSP7_019240 [Xanthoceras sorbifolium]